MKHLCQRLVLSVLLLGSSHGFAQQQIAAGNFDLADYRGKVVYLDFWASWCTPCRASFPFMADMAGAHAGDLAIVAVNVDEHHADAQGFLDDYETPFDIVFDPDGTLASEHQVPGMPTSFLFDRDGQLIGSHVGFRKKDIDTLRDWINAAIAN